MDLGNFSNITYFTNTSDLTNEIVKKSQSVDPDLIQRYIENRAVDEPAYSILIVMYVTLIVVGALGNILVVSCFYIFIFRVRDDN